MKKLIYPCLVLFACFLFLLGAGSPAPDVSFTRIAWGVPEDLGTGTNCDGSHATTTFVKAVTNLAVAFQTTNLQIGVTYEIRLYNRGATATPNVTLTAQSGRVNAAPNFTAAQTLTYGAPIANRALRIIITPGENSTNYVTFDDNY